MWTIGTPITKDYRIIKIWLECFDNLKIDRKQFKVVWLNLSDDIEIENLLQSYKREHESDFFDFVILDKSIKKYPPSVPKESHIRRKTVSESMQILNEHRVGDMVIWEDDIIVDSDAFIKLEE